MRQFNRKIEPLENWFWNFLTFKAIFFESLNECGKNFDAIQVFFHNRNKKNNKLFTSTKESNSLLNKNKEQIRTFYYRTWHKICKYVDFAEYKHLKKSSKELYGLINFGELRKRLGSQLDDKTGVKLRELVFKGKQKWFAKFSRDLYIAKNQKLCQSPNSKWMNFAKAEYWHLF